MNGANQGSRNSKSKTAPPAAFAWFGVLFVYLIGMLYAVGSGAMQRITAHAELPLVLITTLALSVMLVLQTVVIVRRRRFIAAQGFLVFLIPLLFAVIGIDYMPARGELSGLGGSGRPAFGGATDLGNGMAALRRADDSAAQSGPQARGSTENYDRSDRIADRDREATASPDQWFGSAEEATVPETGTIEIETGNYYDLYNQIYDDMHALQGRMVSVAGFVHREATFSDGEFLVGRMLMWCCTADAALLGFMTRTTDRASPENDAWITVTGTVEPRSFENPHTGETYEVPYLIAESVEATERPDFEYVFPF